MIKKIVVAIGIVLVLIQIIRPTKNIAEGISDNDISNVYSNMPSDIHLLLKNKCYDCHSHNTKYPWYANLQPMAWFLAGHIQEGKEHLNFSEFGTYTKKSADHKLEEMVEEVTKGAMPLSSYTFIHREASVTEEEVKALRQWVMSTGVQLND